jgi:hypothetical protein
MDAVPETAKQVGLASMRRATSPGSTPSAGTCGKAVGTFRPT